MPNSTTKRLLIHGRNLLLAYNMGNFLRQAVLPRSVRHWSLTTLREKLIKIGAKVVRHSRQVIFQMAEVAVPRELFQTILERIGRLRSPAAATGSRFPGNEPFGRRGSGHQPGA